MFRGAYCIPCAVWCLQLDVCALGHVRWRWHGGQGTSKPRRQGEAGIQGTALGKGLGCGLDGEPASVCSVQLRCPAELCSEAGHCLRPLPHGACCQMPCYLLLCLQRLCRPCRLQDVTHGHSDAFTGKTFVFSGVLDSLYRDAAKDLVLSHGGRVTGASRSNDCHTDSDLASRCHQHDAWLKPPARPMNVHCSTELAGTATCCGKCQEDTHT